jgi:hypothetical protein
MITPKEVVRVAQFVEKTFQEACKKSAPNIFV